MQSDTAFIVANGPPPLGYTRTENSYYAQTITVDVCDACGAIRGSDCHAASCTHDTPRADTSQPGEREDVRAALIALVAEMIENHPDQDEENYEGAGYCSCFVCQRLRPALHNAAETITTLTRELAEVRAVVERSGACLREGVRLHAPYTGSGTVGERWLRWARELTGMRHPGPNDGRATTGKPGGWISVRDALPPEYGFPPIIVTTDPTAPYQLWLARGVFQRGDGRFVAHVQGGETITGITHWRYALPDHGQDTAALAPAQEGTGLQ